MGGADLGDGDCLLDGSCGRVGPRAHRCLKRLRAGPARAQPVTPPTPPSTSQVTFESRGAVGSLDPAPLGFHHQPQGHSLTHAYSFLDASKIQVL